MARAEEEFRSYVSRRANDIARAIRDIMRGNFDLELEIEEQTDEYEAQIEILVMGFNMMCKELRRLDDIAKNELERAKRFVIEQQELIDELSTPIIEAWDDILVIPIIGVLDSKRSSDIMANLLKTIVEKQSICVILDITGVTTLDSETAARLGKIVQATNLLGARCVLTGVNSKVAQSLVGVGVDFSGITTMRNLKEGLADSFRYLKRREDKEQQ